VILIHASNSIAWQGAAALKMQQGLKAIGLDSKITDSRSRGSDVAICMGTTLWRGIEEDGDYLLVDRASFGDPYFVTLVWNGHGRRGDFKVPGNDSSRRQAVDGYVEPWKDCDSCGAVVLCGQTESYSPRYHGLTEWYSDVNAYNIVTRFRSHPSDQLGSEITTCTENDWKSPALVITLNSSVAVDCVLRGIPTVTMDPAAMAWDVTGHTPIDIVRPDRNDWLNWLTWTQWNWDEIQDGQPIKHLFEAI